MASPIGTVDDSAGSATKESCIQLLKKNVLDWQVWSTREELRIALVTWTDRICDRRRRYPRLAPGDPQSTTRPS